MSKRILITGANSQLGQSLAKISNCYPKYNFTFITRTELDLSNSCAIESYFEDNLFEIIVNFAAYTEVDKAESEPELANQINHLAVKKLAQISKDKNIILIHISTDYVFNGQNFKPYVEEDSVGAQNEYGLTKLKGEQAFQAINPLGMIIRTSWVYSEFGNNFVKTMLRLGQERDSLSVIYDQIGTPTYAGDLAKAILEIVDRFEQSEEFFKKPKIYHYSNEGVCSWYDFAIAIFEINQLNCEVKSIESKEYSVPAKRPYYSLMNKEKIKLAFHLQIPYWKDSLKQCLKQLGEQ